jgi:hypothetical protein
MRRLLKSFILAAVLAVVNFAQTLTYIPSGHVALVEPSYMPDRVQFQMDVGDSTCPTGEWLLWIGKNPDSNKAVYSSLLAALLSNRTVTVIYDLQTVHQNSPQACVISYIHIQ